MVPGLSWTKKEVEYLKSSFLNGQQIKAIARAMGRTPSAVNKALSRFGLRSHKSFQTYYGIPKVATLPRQYLHKKHTIRPTQPAQNLPLNTSRDDTQPEWVSMTSVLDWLKNEQIFVLFRAGHSFPFVVGAKPMTTEQVVLHANKLRLERKQPPFMVENVTW